jgi:hypothetical protein
MSVYYILDVYNQDKFSYSRHCKFVNQKQAMKAIFKWTRSNPTYWSYRNIQESNACDYSVDNTKQADYTNMYLDFC